MWVVFHGVLKRTFHLRGSAWRFWSDETTDDKIM
jgi:hypothetical protein